MKIKFYLNDHVPLNKLLELYNMIVIAKMDSSQHTVLTILIIFLYQTAVNIYKKILKKNACTN